MLKTLSITLLCLLSFQAAADTREEKLAQLAKVTGLNEMFESQMAKGKAQAMEMTQQMLGRMMQNLNPPPAFQEKLQAASTRFMSQLMPTTTSQEMIARWGQAYGKHFTDAELDALLAHYSSPLGQKEKTANMSAIAELQQQRLAEVQQRMGPAVDAFTAEIQQIATDCRCEKPQAKTKAGA